eukprot:GHVO01016925.1.p1 GENE.GHVO01016925.1~~GHVO01016925.1.p1  ORF type:complete len:466 (-),score=34.50 GHVO01016925.1:63-1460(-)
MPRQPPPINKSEISKEFILDQPRRAPTRPLNPDPRPSPKASTNPPPTTPPAQPSTSAHYSPPQFIHPPKTNDSPCSEISLESLSTPTPPYHLNPHLIRPNPPEAPTFHDTIPILTLDAQIPPLFTSQLPPMTSHTSQNSDPTPPLTGSNTTPIPDPNIPPLQLAPMATLATGYSDHSHAAALRARLYPTEHPFPLAAIQTFRFTQWIEAYDEDFEDYQLLYPAFEATYVSTMRLLIPKTVKQIIKQQPKYTTISTTKEMLEFLSDAFGIAKSGPSFVSLHRELIQWEYRNNFRKFLTGFTERYEPLRMELSQLSAVQILLSKLPEAWTGLLHKCQSFADIWEVYLNDHKAQILRSKSTEETSRPQRAYDPNNRSQIQSTDATRRGSYDRRSSYDHRSRRGSTGSNYRRDSKPQANTVEPISDEESTSEEEDREGDADAHEDSHTEIPHVNAVHTDPNQPTYQCTV